MQNAFLFKEITQTHKKRTRKKRKDATILPNIILSENRDEKQCIPLNFGDGLDLTVLPDEMFHIFVA